jgi:uncharacterized protein (DUF302 family)
MEEEKKQEDLINKNTLGNKKNKVYFLLAGFILGILLTGVSAWTMMPKMMLNIHQSKLSFEETIEAIQQSVADNGEWKIPTIHDLQASLVNAGHDDMTKVKVIELCHPDHAYNVLKNDQDKKISAIMPCRVSVYEDKNGQVYIAEMNTKLISKMFGGNISKVMDTVVNEQNIILNSIKK